MQPKRNRMRVYSIVYIYTNICDCKMQYMLYMCTFARSLVAPNNNPCDFDIFGRPKIDTKKSIRMNSPLKNNKSLQNVH